MIAEAPGEQENVQREPLVGGSGRLFDSMCRKAGLKRDDLTLFNVLPVRPPNNVFPTDSAARSYISEEAARAVIAHCVEHHLRPLLDSRPWERVDLLGDKALVACTGLAGGIFQWRGSPVTLVGDIKPRAIPILHPAYLMRDQNMIPVAVNDLKKSCVIPPEYYNLTPTLEDLRAFTATEFAFDIESTPGTTNITMIGLAASPFRVMVVPFSGSYIPELKRIFANAKRVVGQNSEQFDLPMLAANGIRVNDSCENFDTMLAHHLLFPDFPHDLQFISSQFTNKPAVWKSGDKTADGYWEWRCARDTDVTLQIFRQLLPMLKMEKLYDLYSDVQVPLARICKVMHDTGIKTDPSRIKAVREKLQAELLKGEPLLPEKLRTRTVEVKKRQKAPKGTVGKSGKPIKYVYVPTTEEVSPWSSADKVKKFLYGELALPEQVHPKTKKVSIDKLALEKLERRCRKAGNTEQANWICALRKMRSAAHMLASFCKEDVGAVGRVHPSFNVHGTGTGRLSSSGPNFQNIPNVARYLYVPSHADWCLMSVDYASIENRLTALFAGDTARQVRFSDPNFSEHKWNASLLFDVPYEEVEKSHDADSIYHKAKQVTHGLDKGEGAQRIANANDLDLQEVKSLVDKWKDNNRITVEWQKGLAATAEKKGVLRNPFGRARWFWTSSTYTEALGTPAQATGADIIYRAMIALMYERIGWPIERVLRVASVIEPLPKPARLVGQVHDSLIFDLPQSLVPQVADIVRRVCEQPWRELGNVGFPVEIEVGAPGASWAECEVYEPLKAAA